MPSRYHPESTTFKMSNMTRRPQSYYRQSGPSRGAELHDRHYDRNSRQQQNANSQNRTYTAQERRPSPTHPYQYAPRPQREIGYDHWSDEQPQHFEHEFHYRHDHEPEPHYQRVERAWEERLTRPDHYTRPDLRRLLDDPLIHELEHPSGSPRTMQRQRQPIANERDYDDPHDYYTTRRLGRSNLRDHDRDQLRAHPIDRWSERPHREDPYDMVGYVDRRSDYERREYGGEERFLD